MSIVILGASGQLGRDLAEDLSLNPDLVVFPILRSEFDAELDLDNIERKLSCYNPSIIINCIATTNVDWCELNSPIAWKINLDFVYKLVQFCNQKKIQLFHISTDYVFDGLKGVPYTENDPVNPLNIYGLSKASGEMVIRAYMKEFFIFRVSGLFGKYGASGKGGNFITTMQKLAREKSVLNIVADQVSNPTSTIAVTRCIKHFITAGITDFGVYHCVSSDYCSWYDFAREIIALSGLDANKVNPIKYSSYPFKARRPQNSVLSIDKLSSYYQMPTWKDSLSEYMEIMQGVLSQ